MYLLTLPALLLSFLIHQPALAQPSAPGSFNGNLGSWTWDKQQSSPNNELEDSENDDEGLGETSWERLNTERSEEFEPSETERTPQSLTPLDLWRMLWGKLTKKSG